MTQAFCDPPGHRRPRCAREIPYPMVAYPSHLRVALDVANVAALVLYAVVWIAMGTWALAFLAIPFVGAVTIAAIMLVLLLGGRIENLVGRWFNRPATPTDADRNQET